MAALDGSVVNTILPVMQKAFSNNMATVERVVTIYFLVLSGFLRTFERLGDLHGYKSMYGWYSVSLLPVRPFAGRHTPRKC